jgi:type IV secretory pathway protease TraF
VTGLLMLCVAIAAGMRTSGSPSFPVGLSLATGKTPEKGDLVLWICRPLPLFTLAKERGYLGAGFCPDGCGSLFKRLAGVAIQTCKLYCVGIRPTWPVETNIRRVIELKQDRAKPAIE